MIRKIIKKIDYLKIITIISLIIVPFLFVALTIVKNNSNHAVHVSANKPCVALNMSTLPLEVPMYIDRTNSMSISRERIYSAPNQRLIKGSIKWYIEKHRNPATKWRMVVISQNTLIIFCLFPSATRFPMLASILPKIEVNNWPTLVVIMV